MEGAPPELPPATPGDLTGIDPPEHTRIRRLVSATFTARRMQALRGRAQEIVDGLLDAMAASEQPVDFVQAVALPLPITMICELLGVPFEDIRVLHGDTQVSAKGMDTYGSRSLTVGGIALAGACDKVIGKAKRVAAHLMEASENDIEFTAGRLHVRGDPAQGRSIQEIALATFAAHDLPDGMEPTLDSDHTYDPGNFSFPHGTHLCATEVDTETGFVKIRSYVAVDDVGTVVNPLIVEGQVHGGLAQGIAQALYEEAVYDDDGNLVTSTLADYLVPSAADLPSYVTDRTESRAANSLGVKGVGEAGTIASTPAVVNAIVDALRPLGINDVEMPCTPERVWRAIQDARGGEQASAAEQHQARQSDQTQGHSPQGIGTPDQSGGVA